MYKLQSCSSVTGSIPFLTPSFNGKGFSEVKSSWKNFTLNSFSLDIPKSQEYTQYLVILPGSEAHIFLSSFLPQHLWQSLFSPHCLLRWPPPPQFQFSMGSGDAFLSGLSALVLVMTFH